MNEKIERVAADHNGWAQLAVMQDGECVVALRVAQGGTMSPYATVRIDSCAAMSSEVAFAISDTFRQWAQEARRRDVTL